MPNVRWMSEKYDGMRALWTGKKMMLRTGRELTLPKLFSNGFPLVTLDGEIWTRRGLHQQAVGLVNSKTDATWSNATFLVFDIPELSGPFEERMEKLRSLSLPDHVIPIQMVKCTGIDTWYNANCCDRI